MRVLFFGIYDPNYSRNRVLIKGLAMSGAEVIPCNDRSWGPLKYLALIIKHFRLRHSYDVMLVAFPGQSVMLLAWILTRKPIIFDAFTSHYEGYVLDRKTVPPNGIHARWYRWLDRTSCRLADICLTDTATHAEWFAEEFRLPRKKFHPIFVGTDSDMFRPVPEPSEEFTVHFHGHYIPLQGTEYIIRAAVLLRDHGVRFNLIGMGQTYRADRILAKQLNADNITFIPNVPYSDLARWMGRAHICLGIFGDTAKTTRVIPNKAYEAMAMAKPLVTADTSAIRELLDERSAILIPPQNPQALADAILRLRQDPELRHRLGQAGRAVLLANATPAILGKRVFDVITPLL